MMGLGLGLTTDANEARHLYYSQRSVEIFAIWEEVFQSADRLVRVLATQNVSSWVSTTILDWNNAYEHADVLGVAPYFGGFLGNPLTELFVWQMTVDQILDSAAVDIDRTLAYAQAQKDTAAARGLGLIAYEAGQHLVGYGGVENNITITDLFIAANRHPRMKELYLDYLNKWNDIGGGLMAMFNSIRGTGKYGNWGHLEYQDQDPDTAPKWLALLEYLGIVTGVENAEEQMPIDYRLFQNYPNPFNPNTIISYELPKTENVTLKIYNILGEEIKTLITTVQLSGNHVIEWDGTNNFGLKVANGIYIYRLQAENFVKSVKMVFLK